MNFEQAMENTVSAQAARREIEKHGHKFEDFAAEFGWKTEYPGADILGWLGY